MGFSNLLNIMNNYGVKKLIFSSSATVYGTDHKLPWHEDLHLNIPDSPYAQSKMFIEQFLQNISNNDKNWKIEFFVILILLVPTQV